MTKRELVPRYPEPFTITDTLQGYIDGWLTYFRTLSPRVKVILTTDANFKMDVFERKVKITAQHDMEDEEIIAATVLQDWPQIKQIAFAVSVDTALPGQEKQYLLRNTFFFCYGDWAFGLDYFQAVSEYVGDVEAGIDEWEYTPNTYSLCDYSESALSWDYIRSRIVTIIEELVLNVPKPPKE